MKINCDFRCIASGGGKAFRPRKIILNVETEKERLMLKDMMDFFLYCYHSEDTTEKSKIIQAIKGYLQEE